MFSREAVEDLIYKEARLLDEQRFEEWLDLYTGDCVYWIPSWVSEKELTTDPKRELSILYLDRKNLEIYVKRILTGEAHTYTPPSRTARLVTNLMPLEIGESEARVACKWMMHVYGIKNAATYFGDAEYRLVVGKDGRGKISFKKVILINDLIRSGQLILI